MTASAATKNRPSAARAGAALYIYGITHSGMGSAPACPPVDGPAGGEVSLIEEGPLAAIVSTTRTQEFQPRRRQMLAHTKVLETALAARAVLPAQYGTVAMGEAAVRHTLSTHRDALLGALEPLTGTVEFGLKTAWEEAKIYPTLVAADPALAALRDRIHSQPQDQTYYERIELGRSIDAALAQRRLTDTARITSALGAVCREVKPVAEVNELQICHLALLVARDRITEMEGALEALDDTFQDLVRFKLVGPAPAYNFVNIRLNFGR